MTTISKSKKPNGFRAVIGGVLLLSPLLLFSNSTLPAPPSIVTSLCVNCHSISSAAIAGGMSGEDLSSVMQRASRVGGLDPYLKKKYGVGSDLFFLYPSKYVPQMALVEGKLFTQDIENVTAYLNTIPPIPKFIFRGYYWVILILIALVSYFWIRKKARKAS